MASFAEIANEARLDYNKGVDYYKIGQYEKAAKYFRSAINISPDFIDAYYNLGSILEYLKQYDAALSVFQQIVIRNPDDYESVYKAASIAYQLGKYEEALKYTTLIPRSANEYDLSKKLASKIKSTTRRPDPLNVPLSTIDTTTLPNSSYLFEGIQGPTGMVTDDFGNLYVACYADNAVTKIFPDGRRVIYVKDKKIKELSKGNQQKIQFICAIIHEPKLLILDEPFSGLDPINVELFKNIILNLKKQGTSIIFSSYNHSLYLLNIL